MGAIIHIWRHEIMASPITQSTQNFGAGANPVVNKAKETAADAMDKVKQGAASLGDAASKKMGDVTSAVGDGMKPAEVLVPAAGVLLRRPPRGELLEPPAFHGQVSLERGGEDQRGEGARLDLRMAQPLGHRVAEGRQPTVEHAAPDPGGQHPVRLLVAHHRVGRGEHQHQLVDRLAEIIGYGAVVGDNGGPVGHRGSVVRVPCPG